MPFGASEVTGLVVRQAQPGPRQPVFWLEFDEPLGKCNRAFRVAFGGLDQESSLQNARLVGCNGQRMAVKPDSIFRIVGTVGDPPGEITTKRRSQLLQWPERAVAAVADASTIDSAATMPIAGASGYSPDEKLTA